MKTQSTFANNRVKAITKRGRDIFLTLKQFDQLLHLGRIANVGGDWREVNS